MAGPELRPESISRRGLTGLGDSKVENADTLGEHVANASKSNSPEAFRYTSRPRRSLLP